MKHYPIGILISFAWIILIQVPENIFTICLCLFLTIITVLLDFVVLSGYSRCVLLRNMFLILHTALLILNKLKILNIEFIAIIIFIFLIILSYDLYKEVYINKTKDK